MPHVSVSTTVLRTLEAKPSDAPSKAPSPADVTESRPVVLARYTSSEPGATLTVEDSNRLVVGIRQARDQRLPFVASLEIHGVDVDQGLAGVDAWARVARELALASGVVPTVIVVTGAVISGPSLLLGLADFAVFTDGAYAYMSGPRSVETYTGVPISVADLGGQGTHLRSTGLAVALTADADAALAYVADLLSYLPSSVDELPPAIPTDDPTDRPIPEAGDLLPAGATGSYDTRAVIRTIVDDAEFLELRAAWAPNIVTGFASIGGLSVGVVANQTQALAGSIDIPAAQKGARFVATCDAFNVPLLTLVDTSGFLPGKDLEWRGMIRHGAQLAFAYARATVPRIGLILRKSYGGAYIVMDSTNMGNDLMFAWPTAEVAVMGAKGAVEILHRNATAEERLEIQAQYEAQYLTPYPAAEQASITAVITPDESRREIAAGLSMLSSKREKLRRRHHDNSPL